MKRGIYLYLLGFIVALFIQSCSSTKKVVKTTSVEELKQNEYIQNFIDNSSKWQNITGKVALDIELSDKSPMRVSGSIKIKRDNVIQISVAPILGIEVARAEITPSGILVIDRINKRYVQASFDELSSLANCDFNYNILQSLFLNSIFISAKPDISRVVPTDFSYEKKTDDISLSARNTKQFDYTFITSPIDNRLVESIIDLRSTPYGLVWKYDDFKSLDKGFFPTQMKMTIKGVNKPVNIGFDFSRLNTDSKWEANTSVPTKYTRLNLQDLLKALFK